MVEQSITNIVRQYLDVLEERGLPVSHAVIFGSQVAGTADQWSDIDLIVVSPRFDGDRHQQDIALLWHSILDVDSRIQPIPCGVDQWIYDDSSAIIEIARREGHSIVRPPELA